jgi:RNA polymerase sigma-70 factor (ECF subfamily)
MPEADGHQRFAPLEEREIADLRRRLLRAVTRICPSWLAAEAEDLVQVALMRLLEATAKHERSADLSASYIKKAAYSALVDEIRRRQRRQEVPLETDVDAPIVDSRAASPEAATALRQVGEGIQECLGRLIPPRRRAVALFLFGHTVPQVAGLLGWSAMKANNLIFRGLADLRRCLAAKGLRP